MEKDDTGRVYAFDGTLHRVSVPLGSVRRGYAKSVRDDMKCPGYYHTATIGPMCTAEMVHVLLQAEIQPKGEASDVAGNTLLVGITIKFKTDPIDSFREKCVL